MNDVDAAIIDRLVEPYDPNLDDHLRGFGVVHGGTFQPPFAFKPAYCGIASYEAQPTPLGC